MGTAIGVSTGLTFDVIALGSNAYAAAITDGLAIGGAMEGGTAGGVAGNLPGMLAGGLAGASIGYTLGLAETAGTRVMGEVAERGATTIRSQMDGDLDVAARDEVVPMEVDPNYSTYESFKQLTDDFGWAWEKLVE